MDLKISAEDFARRCFTGLPLGPSPDLQEITVRRSALFCALLELVLGESVPRDEAARADYAIGLARRQQNEDESSSLGIDAHPKKEVATFAVSLVDSACEVLEDLYAQDVLQRRRGLQSRRAAAGRAELLAHPAIRARIFAGSIQTPHRFE